MQTGSIGVELVSRLIFALLVEDLCVWERLNLRDQVDDVLSRIIVVRVDRLAERDQT